VRELAEETGLVVGEVGACLWTRETRFRYRAREHHRREAVYLARVGDTKPAVTPRHTADERVALLGERWWSQGELDAFRGRLLPPALPRLLAALLAGELTRPLTLDA
jgi:8-oxo-dGTP pyrophosphatase MutT (NUDIX family)